MKSSQCEKCKSEDWIKISQDDPPGNMLRRVHLKCAKCDHEIIVEIIFTKDENEYLQ